VSRTARPAAAGAAILASTILVACGSGSAGGSGASAANPSPSQAQREALSFARCMRSHGVPHFPDPTASGGIDLNDIPGINSSSPAFAAAQAACARLLPVKRPPSQPPSAHAYARLLRWARCMRAHGIAGLSDPRPDPPPSPGSAVASRYGTLMGDGGYWVGIPIDVDAHSSGFTRLSTTCGESPGGHRG
jgi:hypothetical protein